MFKWASITLTRRTNGIGERGGSNGLRPNLWIILLAVRSRWHGYKVTSFSVVQGSWNNNLLFFLYLCWFNLRACNCKKIKKWPVGVVQYIQFWIINSWVLKSIMQDKLKAICKQNVSSDIIFKVLILIILACRDEKKLLSDSLKLKLKKRL